MTVVSSTLRSVHSNPFNGRCIHGKEGAKLWKGCLTNPKCSECAKAVKPCR